MTPSEVGDRAEIAVMGAFADAGIRVLMPSADTTASIWHSSTPAIS